MSDAPFDSILLDAAPAGRPVFIRLGSWPRGRWMAFKRGDGRLLLGGRPVRHPAPLAWRSETAGAEEGDQS
jgi:hypothetical protein